MNPSEEFSSRKAKKLFKDLDWIMDCMKNGDTSRIYEITLKHMETPRDINPEDL